MLLYFVALGPAHCLCYATLYFIKMTKLPSELLHKLLTGEHDTRDGNGLWNSIWSNMVIEMTFMGYCHVQAGMIGVNVNNSALECWAKNLHVSSVF